jgi:CubicO group peptidase (beta-lactamase class C family)
MKRKVLRAVLALAAVSPTVLAQAPPDVTRMEQIVESYVSASQFMGSVLVARGNDIVLDKGYGFADLEWDVPNSPTTKFRLGSVTKQFTAASILLLEERGKLSVNELVKKYIPDTPAAWDKITIFNLLTHTSGIPNFTSFPEYRKMEPFPATPEQLVALFRDKPLDFQPGERWSYSNSGYVLLGYLIEKISGESYEKFVQENIFTPLGMKDSGYDSNSAIIPHRARGYLPGPGGIANAGYIDMTIPFSAGSLYSTTEDLLRWGQGLFGGKLLSAESLRKMTTPFKQNYAFGLGVNTLHGHPIIAHDGGIEGFSTIIQYFPEDKLTVVVLGNLNGEAPTDIAVKLSTVALGGKVTLTSERKEVHVDPKVYDSLAGRYELAPGVFMAVRRDGDRLMTQLAALPTVEIFPESEHDYFAKVVDAQVTFVTDPGGKAMELILHQNGEDQHAKRVGDVPPAREHKEVAVDRKLFDAYVGNYQLTPNFQIAVTREGDHFFVQGSGQPKGEIFSEGEREFFFKVVDAQITFVTDSSGRATELILHQNGLDQHAKKLP